MFAQITTLPTSLSTSVDLDAIQTGLSNPTVRKILYAVIAFLLLVLVLRVWSRRRETVRSARARAELRAGLTEARMQLEEIKRLASKIIATSSTSRITGFTLIRQIEAVFSDGQKSAELAVDHVKAHAAHKGGNAIINLQTRQMPSGKWAASGDAVVVRPIDAGPSKNPPSTNEAAGQA